MILKTYSLFFLMGAFVLGLIPLQCETYDFSHEQVVQFFARHGGQNILKKWDTNEAFEHYIESCTAQAITTPDYDKSFENVLKHLFGKPCSIEQPTIEINIPSKFHSFQRTDTLFDDLTKELLQFLPSANPPCLSLRINVGPFPTHVLAYHEVVYDPYEDCLGI